MSKRKNIKTIYDKDGPWDFLQEFQASQPKIAEYAMKRIAYEIIKRAKKYVREGHPDWPELYYEGPKVGESTIKWNSESRKENRGRNIPLFDTGELADSIKLFTISTNPNGSFATVGSSLEKAKVLEFGGPNPLKGHKPIPARPFITPAILEVKFGNKFKKQLKKEIVAIYKELLNTGTLRIPTLDRPT